MPRLPMRHNAKPQIERLEDRCVPAGNVFAGIVPIDGDDVLSIQGDQHNNGVAVSSQTDGTIIVVGRDDTTINGMTSASFTLPFPLFPIGLDMGDGDDDVAADFLSDASSGRAVTILTGRGNDEVYCIGGNTAQTILTGDGNDLVRVDQSGDLFIDTGDGQDSLEVRNLVAFRSQINLGRGHDHAVLANLDVWEMFVHGDAGNDVVECRGNSTIHLFALIDLGDGNDTLEGDSATGTAFLAGSLIVVGGQGRDTLFQAPYFDGGPAEVIDSFEVMAE